VRSESLNTGRVSKLSVSPWSHNGSHPSVKITGGYISLPKLTGAVLILILRIYCSLNIIPGLIP
jgi:hypothetical protein